MERRRVICTKALLSHLPSRDITGFVRSVALEPGWKRPPAWRPPDEGTEAHDAPWKKLQRQSSAGGRALWFRWRKPPRTSASPTCLALSGSPGGSGRHFADHSVLAGHSAQRVVGDPDGTLGRHAGLGARSAAQDVAGFSLGEVFQLEGSVAAVPVTTLPSATWVGTAKAPSSRPRTRRHPEQGRARLLVQTAVPPMPHGHRDSRDLAVQAPASVSIRLCTLGVTAGVHLEFPAPRPDDAIDGKGRRRFLFRASHTGETWVSSRGRGPRDRKRRHLADQSAVAMTCQSTTAGPP